jgi:lipid II:glycine glycyltransferase (peptidoglycan interpeptide bridge formation enzyme)
MEIVELDYLEFGKIFSTPNFIFGSGVFCNLNRDKVDSLHYLAFKNKKYRMGITIGIKNNIARSPFSAPFGGFVVVTEDVGILYFEEAVSCLIDWSKNMGIIRIEITLPSRIYGESVFSKQTNALFTQGFTYSKVELNHVYDLKLFNADDYIRNISYNGRRNLRIAFESGLRFIYCLEEYQKKLTYSIVKENRNAKGFPLRMTWDQISGTSRYIKSDFFLVESDDKTPIASAVVFQINNEVFQVIYWGDLPDYSALKPMNFLAYNIFEFYMKKGMKFVDIGPSTENSIPNYGLCEFKESIGCTVVNKSTFSKEL